MYITWFRTPWTVESGWAPDGESYLRLNLRPFRPEYALPLDASDAKVTSGGEEYTPVEVDGDDHTYTFLLPEAGGEVDAEVVVHPDGPNIIGEWGWQEGDTVTAPGRLDCTIPAPER